ncbi:MAG: class A beta-lactamase [Candidatus Obscuribacterales bacterium]|nr:class A beta-lactamase [Candidatus Obscuribacterales bacterium]
MSLNRKRLLSISAASAFMISSILALPGISSPADHLSAGLSKSELAKVQGEVGIAVIDTARNKQFLVNETKQFPMQSVIKLPISLAVLRLVDEGKLSLQDKITVQKKDIIPTNSPIKEVLKAKQADFTVQDLISRTIRDSDNTACDALVNHVGGAGVINEKLVEAGIKGIRVDRPIKTMATDCMQISKFLSDPRDTAEPEAITDLLQKLNSGNLLSKSSTALLMEDLFNCKTGTNRLKAGLPAGWTLAHKTGTGADVSGKNIATNDVGVMVGPKGETIYIAVFTKGSQAKIEVREALMAKIAAKAAAGEL